MARNFEDTLYPGPIAEAMNRNQAAGQPPQPPTMPTPRDIGIPENQQFGAMNNPQYWRPPPELQRTAAEAGRMLVDVAGQHPAVQAGRVVAGAIANPPPELRQAGRMLVGADIPAGPITDRATGRVFGQGAFGTPMDNPEAGPISTWQPNPEPTQQQLQSGNVPFFSGSFVPEPNTLGENPRDIQLKAGVLAPNRIPVSVSPMPRGPFSNLPDVNPRDINMRTALPPSPPGTGRVDTGTITNADLGGYEALTNPQASAMAAYKNALVKAEYNAMLARERENQRINTAASDAATRESIAWGQRESDKKTAAFDLMSMKRNLGDKLGTEMFAQQMKGGQDELARARAASQATMQGGANKVEDFDKQQRSLTLNQESLQRGALLPQQLAQGKQALEKGAIDVQIEKMKSGLLSALVDPKADPAAKQAAMNDYLVFMGKDPRGWKFAHMSGGTDPTTLQKVQDMGWLYNEATGEKIPLGGQGGAQKPATVAEAHALYQDALKKGASKDALDARMKSWGYPTP